MKMLAIDVIITDAGTQMRVGTRLETIKEYEELAAAKTWQFSTPLVVFQDGDKYILADGFHRLEACKNVKRASVQVDVQKGTLRDAIRYALGANQSHGLRRSNDDKRRVVAVALEDGEWGKLSHRQIAKMCGVTHTFVNKLRAELSVVVETVSTLPTADEPKTKSTGSKEGPKGKPSKADRPPAKTTSEPMQESIPDPPVSDTSPARTKKEAASLIRSAIKQHNAAMMRNVDELHKLLPDVNTHAAIHTNFRQIHDAVESWK